MTPLAGADQGTTLTYSGSSTCTKFYDATYGASGRAVVEIYEVSPFAQVRSDPTGRLSFSPFAAVYGYDEYMEVPVSRF